MNGAKVFAWICLFAVCSVSMSAKDGIIFADKPPIAMRYEGLIISGLDDMKWEERPRIHFTNTSDEIVHGVTLAIVVNGVSKPKVIIDTIEPHKTVTWEFVDLFNTWAEAGAIIPTPVWDFSITCKDYSKPIPGRFMWTRDGDRRLKQAQEDMQKQSSK